MEVPIFLPVRHLIDPHGKMFYLECRISIYRKEEHEINAQAENLTEHLLKSNDFGNLINGTIECGSSFHRSQI